MTHRRHGWPFEKAQTFDSIFDLNPLIADLDLFTPAAYVQQSVGADGEGIPQRLGSPVLFRDSPDAKLNPAILDTAHLHFHQPAAVRRVTPKLEFNYAAIPNQSQSAAVQLPRGRVSDEIPQRTIEN